MTTILNLYGGPGVGKSTLAAYAFYRAKKAGVNAELVREYVKDWVWEGRTIGPFDQFYIMGKHIRKESLLYGKCEFVVTDSPVLLPVLYARLYSPQSVARGVEFAVKEFYEASAEQGNDNKHVLLRRVKSYKQEGRFQNEDEARQIDYTVERLLDELDIDFDIVNGDEIGIEDYMYATGILTR